MNELDLKNQIYRYLCLYARGSASAKTGQVIADQFQTDWRTVASTIRQLRIDGILIGSSKGNRLNGLTQTRAGYYIPETSQEKDNYLRSFKNELFDMLKTFNRQKKARLKETENLNSSDLFYKDSPSGQKELLFI